MIGRGAITNPNIFSEIRGGERITKEKLKATEASENFLFSLGLKNFRVRRLGDKAKIEVISDQIDIIIKNRKKILAELMKYYTGVMLDLKDRDNKII